MLLAELVNDYLFMTNPVLNGSVIFVYAQMIYGCISPLRLIYTSVKRENSLETAMIILVPSVLIISMAIFEPLLFGSFLGEGYNDTDRLVAFLNQPAFFDEAIIAGWIFALSSALYILTGLRYRKMSFISTFLSMAPEIMVLISITVLSADVYMKGGALLSSMNKTLIKWFVYGIYLIVYKSALYIVSLVWHVLFSERRLRPKSGETAKDMEIRVRAYLTGSRRTIGIGCIIFAIFSVLVVLRPIYSEDSGTSIFFIIAILIALLMVFGLCNVVISFVPALIPDYRRFISSKDKDIIIRQMCSEIVDRKLNNNRTAILTSHFLITASLWRRYYYLPYFCGTKISGFAPTDSCRLLFSDGSCCRLLLADSHNKYIIECIESLYGQEVSDDMQ